MTVIKPPKPNNICIFKNLKIYFYEISYKSQSFVSKKINTTEYSTEYSEGHTNKKNKAVTEIKCFYFDVKQIFKTC